MQTVMQMKWLTVLTETYRTLTDTAKNLLVFCVSYLLATAFFAAACRICAGWLLDYYTAVALSSDMLEAIRPCVGVTALGVLLTQSASSAS